jgi:uncharacterized membrane protein YgcG
MLEMISGRSCLKSLLAALALALSPLLAMGLPSRQAATAQAVRPIGVVTAIKPGQLTLRTDAGPTLTVSLPDGISVLQVPPGAKSLQEATKIDVNKISVGDRVLIIGPVSAEQKSVTAKTVVVMSKTALEKAREEEQLAWQQRGIAGVVKAVDPATREITLAVPNSPPTPGNMTHPVIVTLAPNATLLRYAPDSVKFSDARPGTLDQIKVGDQMRALGTKSPDGTRYTAEKVVSGTFRNIPATVISVDAAQGTITVKDLATGTPVVVHTNADSKLHELTPQVANMIAMFNAGPPANGAQGAGMRGARAEGGENVGQTRFQRQGQVQGRPGMRGMPPGSELPCGASMNFDQMLQKMPPLSLDSLKAGEPLIVVSTEGSEPGQVTAIAVLSGVDPILRARPKGSNEVALGPWNMSVGGGGGETGGEGGDTGGGGGGQGGGGGGGPN